MVQFSTIFVFKCYNKVDTLKFVNSIFLQSKSPVWFLIKKRQIITRFENTSSVVLLTRASRIDFAFLNLLTKYLPIGKIL